MDSRSEGVYASFSKDTSSFSDVKSMANELAVFQRAHALVAGGLTWHEGGRKTPEENKDRAEIESAALELKYPQLTLIPMFPSLYRYLRTEELNRALSRGGDILLIGSGTTMYEVLSLTVEQPSQQDVEHVFSEFGTRVNNLYARRSEIVHHPDAVEKVPLLPHKVQAYEPDTRQTERFREANAVFGTETVIASIGIQEGYGQVSDSRFDNVALNRTDPAVFQSTPEMMRMLMDLVKPGGSFVVTIGTGKTPEELTGRKAFLEETAKMLPEAGLTITSRLPMSFEKQRKRQFGSEVVGGVIGRRI
ncbi:MAG: hypothetical protein ACM3IJ_05735 [Candidatus Levyibacteriota bacterium]